MPGMQRPINIRKPVISEASKFNSNSESVNDESAVSMRAFSERLNGMLPMPGFQRPCLPKRQPSNSEVIIESERDEDVIKHASMSRAKIHTHRRTPSKIILLF